MLFKIFLVIKLTYFLFRFTTICCYILIFKHGEFLNQFDNTFFSFTQCRPVDAANGTQIGGFSGI